MLARKKMLAELELNDGHGIVINGKEVSKNDIIRFFDELQQSDDLSYHIAVYKDKVLLKFLEYNILENREWFALTALYTEESFIEWISPYYAASFIAFAGECYRNFMDREWATLLGNRVLMNRYARETAWISLEKLIRVNISRLEFIESKPVWEFTKEEVKGICDFRHVEMLALLPVERFGQVRDELAFSIMRLSIKMFNHVDRKWAIKRVEQAHALAVSERMKEVLYNKQVEMEILASKGRWHDWKSNFRLGSPRIIFLAFFLLIQVITCNRDSKSSDSDNFQYAPVEFMDSIRQATQKRADPFPPATGSKAPLPDSATKELLQRLNHER